MPKIHRETTVKEPLEVVYKFFNAPENLEKLTPSFLKFKILTPSPITMQNNLILDYQLSIFGIPLRWTSVIQNYHPGTSFTDIQLKGPYSFWHHHHLFEQTDSSETKISDIIHYEVGFGPLGGLINMLIIKHQLAYIFNHRQRVIESLFTVIK